MATNLTTVAESVLPFIQNRAAFTQEEYVMRISGALFLNYFIIGTLAIFAVDMLITLPEEIRYVWGSKITPYICLYWFMKFFPPGVLLFTFIVRNHKYIHRNYEFCQVYAHLMPILTTTIPPLAGEVLMTLRVWVLYGCTRKFLIGLALLFLSRSAVIITLHTMLVVDTHAAVLPPTLVYPGCLSIPARKTSLLVVSAIINIFTTSILFAFTIRKFLQNYKIARLATKGTGLLGTFLRDGSFYMMCVLVAEIAFAVIITQYATWSLIWQPINLGIYGLCSTRLVLTLRKAATIGKEQTAYEMPSLQPVAFARPSDYSTKSVSESIYSLDGRRTSVVV